MPEPFRRHDLADHNPYADEHRAEHSVKAFQ